MNAKTQLIPGLGLCLGATALGLAALDGVASSHREAPFVTENPKVDGTDFYFFRSYETGREGFVTLVANYLPIQAPFAGPNYFALDQDALYEIHIDTDGDANEDVTFQFRFQYQLEALALDIGDVGQEVSVEVPLMNITPFDQTNQAGLNVRESYTVDVVFGDRRTGTSHSVTNNANGESTFVKPADRIGTKSVANYDSYAAAHVYDILLPTAATGRMFVGQRKDPFVVNLGETFDLINTNPLGPVNGETDALAGSNVTSLVLELPIGFLVDTDPVLGAWTTASLRQARVINPNPDGPNDATVEGGAWTQVSRLGMPLVNEVVIGLSQKDRFNANEPSGDAQFLEFVTHPTMPELIQTLFGVTAPNQFPRDDLVEVFLTGIPGLNAPNTVVASEMLRLDTTTAAVPKGSQNNLGVIAGDNAGFPNGRRPGDDVVDISLRVVMGVLLPAPVAPDGQLPYTDGALVDDAVADDAFPYLTTPLPGSPN